MRCPQPRSVAVVKKPFFEGQTPTELRENVFVAGHTRLSCNTSSSTEAWPMTFSVSVSEAESCIFCNEWKLKWRSTTLLLAAKCLTINSVFQSILILRNSFYLMTAPFLILSPSVNCFLKEQFKQIYKPINLLSNNYGNIGSVANDRTCWEIYTYSSNAEICNNLLWLYFYCRHSVVSPVLPVAFLFS